MKLALDLPIFFRGRPKGSRGVRDIFCKTTYHADVPEISLREMPVVFRVQERNGQIYEFPDQNDTQMVRRNAAKKASLKTPYTLRTFDGVLYRQVARTVAEAERLGLFVNPFDERLIGRYNDNYPLVDDWPTDFGGDISPIRVGTGNGPLARPLVDEFEWHIDRGSTAAPKMKTAWPTPVTRREDDMGAGWHTHRNAVDFNDHIQGISEIDRDSMERAFSMIETQASKLLIAGGEIWMKSRPPAYRVQYKSSYYRGPPSQILVSMVTAPESYVGDLKCEHFALNSLGAAMAEAHRWYGREQDWGDGYKRNIVDETVPYEVYDDGLLHFNHEQEEINRFGYVAAVETMAYLGRKPESQEKLTTDELSTVQAAFSETLEVNHILGVHRDMTAYVPALATAWRKFSNKQLLTGGMALTAYGQMAAKRALEYIENAPIEFDLKPQTRSTPQY
jgi:hypothetical protein